MASAEGIYGFRVKGNNGKEVSLSDYKGKALLVVNTASRCGYTPQYKDLEAIHEKFAPRGLEILAFPSNDFGKQEPGTDAEIKHFCDLNYKIRFPLFAKGPVSGPDKQALFAYLTDKANPQFKGEIEWNFEKFLIDRDGTLVGRFKSKVKPTDPQLVEAMESALGPEKPAKK